MPSPDPIDTVTKGAKVLVDRINDQFYRAIMVDHQKDPNSHPIIVVNAVKNIIGDDRNNPSEILLNFIDKYLTSFSPREDVFTTLETISNEGIGLTVFVENVEEALSRDDRDEVERQMAKQLLASDRSPATLEMLAELALLDFANLGTFTYHWLRSFQFHQDKELIWPYLYSIINEIFKSRIMPQNNYYETIQEFDSVQYLDTHDTSNWSRLSVASRFIIDDYVRADNFKRIINTWIITQTKCDKNIENKSNELYKYHKHGGHYFIHLSEEIILNSDRDESLKKIIVLEALRGLTKVSSVESLPRITQCINLLT